MNQQDFEQAYGDMWSSFEAWLTKSETSDVDSGEVPRMYRRVCHHLSLARARNYSPRLEDRLNRLALDGHRALYAARAGAVTNLWRFFADEFPRCVRRNVWLVLLSGVLFYGPFAAMITAIAIKPSLAYSVISPSDAARYEEMYADSTREASTRDSADDVFMFGFYIYNNIGIGFYTFGSGVLFGLGSLYVVFSNGLGIGAVFGHLWQSGHGHNLFPFVAGHGSFELNAIVLAGASGLRMGFSFFAPGRRRRLDALRHAANDVMPMVYGFTTMLLIAAFIEAFWSSTQWPPAELKYAVGAALWVLVIAYFILAGRRHAT